MSCSLTRRNVLLGLVAGPLPGPALAGTEPPAPAPSSGWWAANCAGYLPGGFKRAFLHVPPGAGPSAAGEIEIIAAEGGAVLAHADGLSPLSDPLTRMEILAVDFSTFATPGRYALRFAGTLSPELTLAAHAYDGTIRALLRSFYLERCGAALNDAENDLFRRPCHTEDRTLADEHGAHRDAHGGWHDGGSYTKTTALAAEATLRLLALAELVPSVGGNGTLALPSSARGERDILSEARVGTELLLRLQTAEGMLSAGVGGEALSARVAPQDDLSRRIFLDPSREATMVGAAALAMSRRLWAEEDPLFAEALKTGAERAAAALGPIDSPALAGHETGAMILVLELWRAGLGAVSDEAAAHALAAVPTDDRLVVSALPFTLAALAQASGSREALLAAQARSKLAAAVANLAPFVDLFLGPGDPLTAAPLARAAGLGLLFAVAARIFARSELRRPAQRIADHMLGANAFGSAFVSAGGGAPMMAHAAALADRVALPGFLMGGLGEEHRDWYVEASSGRAVFRAPGSNPATAPTLAANATLAGLLALLAESEPRAEETAVTADARPMEKTGEMEGETALSAAGGDGALAP